MNENTIIRTVPAASELHKVPGFDPLKYLRKAVSGYGEPVLRLELPYKRLWFRLAYPSGRLLLNPLRVTDQMAIFEAQVFFNREDAAPASSFTSEKRAREIRGYIRAAQDEALNEALDNAGFGIQLCDMTQASGEGQYSSDVRLTQNADKRQGQSVEVAASAQAAKEPAAREIFHTPATVQQTVDTAHAPAAVEHPADEAEAPAPEPKEAPAPVQTEQQRIELVGEHTEQPSQSDATSSVVTVLNFSAPQSDTTGTKEAPASDGNAAEAAEPETPARSAPSYTDDMPVEEILRHMTLDEALAFQIKTGICKGWTLAQVAESRPSSLNFYTNSCCTGGNILKAAATLVLRERGQQKAG